MSTTVALINTCAYAAWKHRNQSRKNVTKDSYIVHPLRVMQIVAEYFPEDVQLLQAAVLHDTIEDTDTTKEELQNKFGAKVSALVMEVTDDKSLPKEERKRLQIEHAPNLSPKAQIIKLADKVANLEDLLTQNGAGIPEDWSVERVQEYVLWSILVCRCLATAAPALHTRMMKMTMGTFVYLDGKLYPCVNI